jgi:hypothetical protein
LVDDIWDEVLTGGSHNVTNSAGKRLRQLGQSFIITEGTAQAGTTNTITLAAGESSTDNIYRGDRIVIFAGTGAAEHGIITSYNGTTKVATMSENWVVTPDATSEYELTPADVDVETWQHTTVTNSATTSLPCVDTRSISDDATAADNLEKDYDGTGYNKTNSTIGTCTTNTDMVSAAPSAAAVASAVLTTAMTESYAALGAAPTLAQGIYAIQQILWDHAATGTTLTVRKLDGATTAMTGTFDDATAPTSLTRAS